MKQKKKNTHTAKRFQSLGCSSVRLPALPPAVEDIAADRAVGLVNRAVPFALLHVVMADRR
jgi:hypothetical protein